SPAWAAGRRCWRRSVGRATRRPTLRHARRSRLLYWTFARSRRRPRRATMSTKPCRALETFPNPRPGRDYEIDITCPEFTAVCPITGQPDFATIHIVYVPDERCVELKSLKLYFWSYRDEGHFHEDVTNRILDDLVETLAPRRIE